MADDFNVMTMELLVQARKEIVNSFPCNCIVASEDGGYCMHHGLLFISLREQEVLRQWLLLS